MLSTIAAKSAASRYDRRPDHAFLYGDGGMRISEPSAGMGARPTASTPTAKWSAGLLPRAAVLEHAFLYQHGVMTDLNSLLARAFFGCDPQYATAINDNGWIVGRGVNPSGQTDAFLLTPTPEPSTFALLGVGAIGLMGWAWRRKRVYCGMAAAAERARRRWFRLTPDRCVLALLALEGFLLLSAWFRWFPFNQHKGWTVLICLATVGAALC